MVRKIFALFHRELAGVHQAAFLLASTTIASSILALVRDRLLATRFGAGEALDIYYSAFRIPDILYAISLFFVASTAVIPLFLEKVDKEDQDGVLRLMSSLFTIFVLLMGAIVLGTYLLLPVLMPLLVPGFETSASNQSIMLSRVLLLSPLLLGISNLFASVLQTFRRFFFYAMSPLFYNLGIIGGIIFFLPRFGLVGLAWGVVLGALLHMLVQVPSLMALGYLPRISFGLSRDVARVFRQSFPRTLGLTATQLAFAAVTAIASTLGAGSIAVFNLSYNLQSIPLSVIGLSYSVAAFPAMADLIVRKERKVFFKHLASAARHILFWTIPFSVLFVVLRAQIVRTVLGAGAFSWVDTRLTAASLALFAISISAQSLAALFTRALYAVGRTGMPVLVNMCSAGATIILASVLVHVLSVSSESARIIGILLRVEGVPHVALLGLPLAFALGSILNAVLLGLGFHRVEGEFREQRLFVSLGEILVSSALMGVVSYGILNILAHVFDIDTFIGIFLQGAVAGVAGIVAGAAVLAYRGNSEFVQVWQAFHRRFWKRDVMASEPEHL